MTSQITISLPIQARPWCHHHDVDPELCEHLKGYPDSCDHRTRPELDPEWSHQLFTTIRDLLISFAEIRKMGAEFIRRTENREPVIGWLAEANTIIGEVERALLQTEDGGWVELTSVPPDPRRPERRDGTSYGI